MFLKYGNCTFFFFFKETVIVLLASQFLETDDFSPNFRINTFGYKN